MTTTRSEFCKIVGLEEGVTRLPHSAAIRALWLQAADTYETEALQAIWRYQSHAFARHCESVGTPVHVRNAVVGCMVQVTALRVQQGRPINPNAKRTPLWALVERVTEPSWLAIQKAVEHLAETWEEIGH